MSIPVQLMYIIIISQNEINKDQERLGKRLYARLKHYKTEERKEEAEKMKKKDLGREK